MRDTSLSTFCLVAESSRPGNGFHSFLGQTGPHLPRGQEMCLPVSPSLSPGLSTAPGILRCLNKSNSAVYKKDYALKYD